MIIGYPIYSLFGPILVMAVITAGIMTMVGVNGGFRLVAWVLGAIIISIMLYPIALQLFPKHVSFGAWSAPHLSLASVFQIVLIILAAVVLLTLLGRSLIFWINRRFSRNWDERMREKAAAYLRKRIVPDPEIEPVTVYKTVNTENAVGNNGGTGSGESLAF